MNKLPTLFFLFFINFLFAQIPSGYYDSAQGLTGYQLKTELSHIITNGHVAHSYNDLYTAYQTTDIDHYYENDGTILDMYSEIPNGPDSYEYSPTSQHCGQYSQEGDCYNREHLMPQSIFGSASPMKSDAHFVVPTDGYVNNRRSSYPFGEVSNPTWTSTNGSKLGNNTTQGYSGRVFEPIDEFKGDIARMLFYVATRYESQIAGWGNSDMLNHTSDQVFSDWFLHVLLSWSNQDPVSQREIDRNNAVYNYQGNRNPFIDHPEWVNAIWNPTPDTTPPSTPANLHTLSVSSTAVMIGWDAANDNIAVASYEIYVDNNLQGTTTDTQYQITGLTPATTYSICVKAKDTSGNISSCSVPITVTTNNAATFTVNQTETFDNCPGTFVAINEASNKNWTCIGQYGENNSPAIQMNGYQEDVPSKDWLITNNAINFDDYINEKLSMFLAYAYGTTPLEVVYSTDYDGNGSPWLFTWTPVPNLNIPTPTGAASITELTINNADVSSITGTSYLAFKYYSNGSPTRWTVDSVKLAADSASGLTTYLQNHTKIYPNPVQTGQNLYLLINDLKINNIQIFDTTGKLIQSFKELKKSYIPTTGYKPGIYFIQFTTNKGMVTKKLSIE